MNGTELPPVGRSGCLPPAPAADSADSGADAGLLRHLVPWPIAFRLVRNAAVPKRSSGKRTLNFAQCTKAGRTCLVPPAEIQRNGFTGKQSKIAPICTHLYPFEPKRTQMNPLFCTIFAREPDTDGFILILSR